LQTTINISALLTWKQEQMRMHLAEDINVSARVLKNSNDFTKYAIRNRCPSSERSISSSIDGIYFHLKLFSAHLAKSTLISATMDCLLFQITGQVSPFTHDLHRVSESRNGSSPCKRKSFISAHDITMKLA